MEHLFVNSSLYRLGGRAQMRLNLINGESRRDKWSSSIHVELCAGLSGFNLAQNITEFKGTRLHDLSKCRVK